MTKLTYISIIGKLLGEKKYSEIFDKHVSKCEVTGDYDFSLNPENLISDFIKDFNLESDFEEYCKMRFEIDDV